MPLALNALNAGMVCGFKGGRQMKTWMGKEALQYLKIHGFQITVFDIRDSEVLMGRKQVFFRREDALLLCTLEIKA